MRAVRAIARSLRLASTSASAETTTSAVDVRFTSRARFSTSASSEGDEGELGSDASETVKRPSLGRGRRRSARRATPDPAEESNVYVKNMPKGVTEASLRETFQKYGPIFSTRALNPDGPWPGGLVRFVRAESARKAIEAASEGTLGTLEGAPGALVVRLATKRPEKKGEEEASTLSSVVESAVAEGDGEGLVATTALEQRKAELANLRKAKAARLASETAKAKEMSEARRAERIAAAKENLKGFVPRYKRIEGAKLDPSLRATTSTRRRMDGEFVVGLTPRRRNKDMTMTRRKQRKGDGEDAKIQQALNERIRQARQLQAANQTYNYDRHEFTRVNFLLMNEKFDVTHIFEKPRLAGSDESVSDEERIESKKAWLMEAAGLSSEEEYQILKNEALEARAQERTYERLMRKKAGLSPFVDNFLAERASLEAIVSNVSDDNVLREFSQLAAKTLDANPYWKYSDKVRLLEKLEREASAASGLTAD